MIEKLCEVLRLCYEISTSTDADVFFRYSPHIGDFQVDYHEFGWEKQKEATYLCDKFSFDIDEKSLDSAISGLNDLKARLMPETEDADERL